MSIKICQREYFTEQLPDALPLAILEDINESYSLLYKLPKQEKKMRKAMRFAKTIYAKTTDTKFAKASHVLRVENLEVDEVAMLNPLSINLKHLFQMKDITLEMVEECTCIHALGNWCYSLKLPLSSSESFMKGALSEKIKKMIEAEKSAELLNFQNTKLKKDEQDEIYRKIREMERANKEAEELAEKQRAARRRQAAVEMMDLDLILIQRVQKISVEIPYMDGKQNLDRIILPSSQFKHLLEEASGGVYGGAERPDLEIVEFEFNVFLPPPSEEEERYITLVFLFDRVKSLFIMSKKVEDRLLLYVHQGGKGNLWQHNIKTLKSAVCRVDQDEFSTLDVFLQKQWRRFLIRHIAPMRTDPGQVAFVRELRQSIVKEGNQAMEVITPEASESDSSSEDSRVRRKRLRKEKRLKKKKIEAKKAKKEKKKKSKKKESKNEKADFEQEGKEEEASKDISADLEENQENFEGTEDDGVTDDDTQQDISLKNSLSAGEYENVYSKGGSDTASLEEKSKISSTILENDSDTEP